MAWPKDQAFLLLIAAAAAQPQPDGARLSTSQWNVCSAAYAAQPRPSKGVPRPLKPSLNLAALNPAAKTQLQLSNGVPRPLNPAAA